MWRKIIKDLMIPHSLPWLCFLICDPPRDLRPCVSGWTSSHYLPSMLIHCQLGLLFVLRFFAFHSQSQPSILLTQCSESKVALAILSEEAVHFSKFFFIYTGSFSHLKNTYTFPVRSGYPLILHEIEKMPLGTARLYLTVLIDLTFTSSHLHSNHSYLMLHMLVSLTFF